MPGLRTEPNTARQQEGSMGEGLTAAEFEMFNYIYNAKRPLWEAPKNEELYSLKNINESQMAAKRKN
jgi:hypothetical protein